MLTALAIITFLSGFLKYTPFEHSTFILIFMLFVGGVSLIHMTSKIEANGYLKFFLVITGVSTIVCMLFVAITVSKSLLSGMSISDTPGLSEGLFYFNSLLFLIGVIGSIILFMGKENRNSSKANGEGHIVKVLFIPILVLVFIVLVFLNVKNIPFDLNEKDGIVLRYFVKFIMTIIFPLALIHLFYKNKGDFGIYFPKFSDAFKLSIRACAIGGPAGITFLLIGMLGWGFTDWAGSITLTVVYLVVFYLVPKITTKLPTRTTVTRANKSINGCVLFGILTVVVAYFTYRYIPFISKILYYIFIVGLGEELLFRGYLQSSFNSYFGKSFHIGNVKFGWGLILAAILFGAMHALVVAPPLWPWALFTFAIGLTLGFIRKKDGSILSAVLRHALFDLPLVFFTP